MGNCSRPVDFTSDGPVPRTLDVRWIHDERVLDAADRVVRLDQGRLR